MRRAVPVLAATAGSLALLANFHTTPSPGATVTRSLPPGPATTTPAAGSDTTAPTLVTPTSVAPGPTTAPRPATTVARSRVINGTDVPTRYGDVQVRVTLDGSRIVDVQAIQLPSSHQRSVEISQAAAPRLRAEALQAQSANIDVVSGASYTSIGYARSLQGALDQAG
jgi:uncharacterized protein with FMN-binding domain